MFYLFKSKNKKAKKLKTKKRKKGFTLLEILVAIIIIGVLATGAIYSINGVRVKSRDTKRITDIKQMKIALEMYNLDHNKYPETLEFGGVLNDDDGRVYLHKIPNNPAPSDGDCNFPNFPEYEYNQIDNGKSYSLNFCLGGYIGSIGPDSCSATPDGICEKIEQFNPIVRHTGQIVSYRDGDDAFNNGTIKNYVDNGCGAGTVSETTSNLCWQKDDQPDMLWNDAIDYCNDLALGGHTDWRLPSIIEGATMIDYSCDSATPAHCYSNFQNNALNWINAGGNGELWLSTTRPDNPDAGSVLLVGYAFPYTLGFTKSDESPVRCVRGVSIFHTGQTISYRDGDDAFHDGVGRNYVDDGCGEGTVLETTSNLCWQKDDQSYKLWNTAIDYCNDLELGGHEDWRLPSIIEGFSMLDYSCDLGTPAYCNNTFRNNALNWVNTNTKAALWLSTTKSNSASEAYVAHANNGCSYFYPKASMDLPVRCIR